MRTNIPGPLRPGPLIFLTAMIAAPPPGLAHLKAPAEKILIEDVPHVRQQPDFCGEACIAMVLQKLGHEVTQQRIFDLANIDPTLGPRCPAPKPRCGLGWELSLLLPLLAWRRRFLRA